MQVILADICGFWHDLGDDSQLCLALARHRIDTERRVLENTVRFGRNTLQYGAERQPQTVRRICEAVPSPVSLRA